MPLITKGGTHPAFEQKELTAEGARRGDPRARWRSSAIGGHLSADDSQHVVSYRGA
jgi:hypothetical protein